MAKLATYDFEWVLPGTVRSITTQIKNCAIISSPHYLDENSSLIRCYVRSRRKQ